MGIKTKATVIDLSDMANGDDAEIEKALADLGDEVPDEVKGILRRLTKGEGKSSKTSEPPKNKLNSVVEAQAAALEYYAQGEPEVGQLVTRNKYGMERYRYPQANKNEACIIIAKFPYRLDTNGGGIVNGAIALVSENDANVRTYAVDLRCYEAAKVAKVDAKSIQ